MKFPDIIGSSDKKFRNYRYKTNVSGNYSPKSKATGTAVAKYSKVTAAKGKLRQIGQKIAGSTTAQQRFLGKTLPKALFKVGKLAYKNPVIALGVGLAPGIVSAMGKQKGISFAGTRQYNKKGRKIT